MSSDNQRWGIDLRLLRNLDQQNDRDRGADIAVRIRPETGQVDLDTLTELDNLKQALLLRFLTPVGELAALGHPSYGSRLFELLGEPITPTTLNRAKLFTLVALEAEPRVKEVLSVKVTYDRRRPTQIDIDVSLRPIDSDTVLNLVFPFFIEGGPTV
ncbi:MAG: hypothetical protein Kow0042_16740 [Calditrichia bacterium]